LGWAWAIKKKIRIKLDDVKTRNKQKREQQYELTSSVGAGVKHTSSNLHSPFVPNVFSQQSFILANVVSDCSSNSPSLVHTDPLSYHTRSSEQAVGEGVVGVIVGSSVSTITRGGSGGGGQQEHCLDTISKKAFFMKLKLPLPSQVYFKQSPSVSLPAELGA